MLQVCSENLQRSGKTQSFGDLCDHYDEKLVKAIQTLGKRSIFLSVSGKEPCESPFQLQQIAHAVAICEHNKTQFVDRVMYTNLSGFVHNFDFLLQVIQQLKLTRIECSRHHYEETANHNIVRFKSGVAIKENIIFKDIVSRLSTYIPIKIACVLQKTGIDSVIEVTRFLDFAANLGVHEVVFRELSVFGDSIDSGTTAEYIISHRVKLIDILDNLDDELFTLFEIIQGYYYYSFAFRYRTMTVRFEMSDYEEMSKKHSGDQIYKLIFSPDGRLCRDWAMQNEISDLSREIQCVEAKSFHSRCDAMLNIASLITHNADAVLGGSLGIYLVYPQILDHSPSDVDLYAFYSMDNLRKIIRLLKNELFRVYSWQDEIDEDCNENLLRGRYYFRARKGDIVVDVTYETVGFNYDQLRDYIKDINNVRVYNCEGQLKAIEHADTDRFNLRIEKLRHCLE